MIQIVHSETARKYFPGLASLGILRLDLPDPVAGGNKSWKLKYHLEAFRRSKAETLLTFGGAFSNHIAAVSAAGKREGIPTIGIIRGDELEPTSNAVLSHAASCGMQLHFVTRQEYSRRYDDDYHDELKDRFKEIYIIPEGGSGETGIRGCTEILNEETENYDEVIVPAGTGATLAGLIRSANMFQRITGIAIGSSTFDGAQFDKAAALVIEGSVNFNHALGGYAKSNEELKTFVHKMKAELDLPLDHVYSGKTLFAIHNMTTAGSFAGKNLLFVHTGGYAFAE